MPRGVKGSGPARKHAAQDAHAFSLAPTVDRDAKASPLESSWRPLGSVNVDGLCGVELKAYAARAGVRRADIDGLSEDRLRQNIKLTIANHFELLAE